MSFHLRSIYEKLHVHSRSEAVARALREGFSVIATVAQAFLPVLL